MSRNILKYADDTVTAIRIARKVFSNSDEAEYWLNVPNTNLSDQIPADLLTESDEAAASVIKELNRLLKEQEKSK